MINVNAFSGATDNERIEQAIAAARGGEPVLIPPRVSDIEHERDYWLLDRAILLPSDTTVILQDCKIKLSDACRDNFFRSANCGLGISDPAPLQNIFIRGEGSCVLEGADHPRAVGDASKTLANPCPYFKEDALAMAPWISTESRERGEPTFEEMHFHSYGTDAGAAGESQCGDWRGIGILLANVEHFGIENLRMVDPHGWAISLEACAHGYVRDINFDARMSKIIDGFTNNMENQDGIDLRNGCHHITVSDITGEIGDDVVALTAIADPDCRPGGSLGTTQVMHNDWTRRSRDIHDVTVRNLRATSNLCHLVRLLACEARIWNVTVDSVTDTCPVGHDHSSGVQIGDVDLLYGKNLPDSVSNITISNVDAYARRAIGVSGYLSDSTITNVQNRRPGKPALELRRRDPLRNVKISNLKETKE